MNNILLTLSNICSIFNLLATGLVGVNLPPRTDDSLKAHHSDMVGFLFYVLGKLILC